MADWGYDRTARRYRDLGSGRFLPRRDVVALRDAVVDAAGAEARSLAERAARGEITPDQFRSGMRVVVRNAHVAEYVFGRGGVNAMGPADFGRLGQTLRSQFAYLERFAFDLQVGKPSEAQAAARAQLYVNGGTLSFERGQAAAWGIGNQLPAMPADGGTPCLSNCRCRWDIKETEAAIEATWRLGAGESCDGCKARAARYAPYSMPRYVAQPDTAPVRLAAVRRAVA